MVIGHFITEALEYYYKWQVIFFLLKLFTFQFCVLSQLCSISLLQSIIHIALYEKKHLQIIFASSTIIQSLGSLFCYIVFQENT